MMTRGFGDKARKNRETDYLLIRTTNPKVVKILEKFHPISIKGKEHLATRYILFRVKK